MNSYKFGFLGRSESLQFSGGEIHPMEDFEDTHRWIVSQKHKDGFFYPPPTVCRFENGEELPNSRRPAHLYGLPASHRLQLSETTPSTDIHRTDASFIIQLLGYLYETWLQFDDWWLDARVPMRPTGLCNSKPTAEKFMSHSYAEWRKWPTAEQRRFVSILFMFNRAPSYEWDWEHFMVEYIVLDGLYKTALQLKQVSEVKSHGLRFQTICKGLGLAPNNEKAREFVALRNDLMHEALWNGGQPGSGGSNEAYICQYNLRKFNQRLIAAILRFNNEFVESNWWSLGRFDFADP